MSLVHEMERIGRITAADQNLDVRVRGVRAYAVPGVVTIPNLSTFDWLGSNAYRMLHGLLDHECGHAADSDFEATKQFRLTKPSAALDVFANMVEDGYVERLRGIRYKGCGQNIELMNEWFYAHKDTDDQDVIQRIADSLNKWLSFMSAVGMVLTPYGHRDIEFFKSINSDIYQMLCESREDLEELQNITKSQATGKNIEIARRIYDRFNKDSEENKEKDRPEENEPEENEDDKSEDEEQKEKPDNEENGEDQESGDQNGEGEEPNDDNDSGEDTSSDGEESGEDQEFGDQNSEGEESDGDNDSEEDTSGEGEECGDEGEPGKGKPSEVVPGDEEEEGSEGSESEDGDADGDPPEEGTFVMNLDRWSDEENTSLNPSDKINVIIGEIFEQTPDVQPYTIFSHEFDAYRDFAAEDQTEVSEQYEKEMEEVYGVADSLIHCFEAALRATQMARPVGGHDEGIVDADVLGEYAVGSLPADQLYIQYAETDSDNVAVSILCDCSGSMRGKRQELCRYTAMAISHALQQVHIAHEVSGFTTFQSYHTSRHPWARGKVKEYEENFERMREALAEVQAQGTNVTKFAREVSSGLMGGVVRELTQLMVPFHVQFKSFESDDARSLARITSIDQNLDGEAVYWIAQRLAERQERRKVLFVLSDGLPAGSHDNNQGARYLKETIDRVIESGIEIYGIGIQSDHVKNYYPEWWLCDKIEDLISIAMEGLIEVLTRNRQERDRVTI